MCDSSNKRPFLFSPLIPEKSYSKVSITSVTSSLLSLLYTVQYKPVN